MAISRLCSIPGCDKPYSARGMCRAHYASWGRRASPISCTVEGCGAPQDRLGLCTAHYMRQRRNNGDPVAGRASPGSREAFIRTAAATVSDDCIIWPFPPNKRTGYGIAKLEGVSMTAHRAVLALFTGEMPPRSIHAAHLPTVCHNRMCVNPTHLRWATAVENEADKRLDGTLHEGPKSHRSVLTEEQVRYIRSGTGRSDLKIAKEIGVSEFAVRSARIRRTYRNV